MSTTPDQAAATDARARAQEYRLERRMFRRLSSGQVIETQVIRALRVLGWYSARD
jgi:hypothetical protein